MRSGSMRPEFSRTMLELLVEEGLLAAGEVLVGVALADDVLLDDASARPRRSTSRRGGSRSRAGPGPGARRRTGRGSRCRRPRRVSDRPASATAFLRASCTASAPEREAAGGLADGHAAAGLLLRGLLLLQDLATGFAAHGSAVQSRKSRSRVFSALDLARHLAVEDDGRGEAAGAEAAGGHQRDLAVRRGLAGLDAVGFSRASARMAPAPFT